MEKMKKKVSFQEVLVGPLTLSFSERENITKLVRNCSEDELEWIFNLILRNVESALGVATNKILDWVGSDSCALWDQTHDLRAVLNGRIANSESLETAGEETLDEHLFRIWTPMLLQKQKRGNWYASVSFVQSKKFKNQRKVSTLIGDSKKIQCKSVFLQIEKHGGSKFFLQTKFDGENVLLHKKGTEYRWFTRNNNDFSKVRIQKTIYRSSQISGIR